MLCDGRTRSSKSHQENSLFPSCGSTGPSSEHRYNSPRVRKLRLDFRCLGFLLTPGSSRSKSLPPLTGGHPMPRKNAGNVSDVTVGKLAYIACRVEPGMFRGELL